MKKYKFIFLATVVFFAASCDLLDRPQLNDVDDATFWTSEHAVRLFANEFYPQFFVGYNSGFGTDYTPIRGFTLEDGMIQEGQQTSFMLAAPETLPGMNNNTTAAPAWQPLWQGPSWYFGWIRKANMMIERIETRMGDILNEEQTNHWIAVARFFRALDYARLVSVFGDVPFFDREVDISDRPLMFKDRDPRNFVMDRIFEDFEFALENLRPRHLTHQQELNQDVAAAFITRWMLFEGTWQWYHYQNEERARRFLKFAVYAADRLIASERYSIDWSFRELFGSQNLAPSREPILFRSYASGFVLHSVGSHANPRSPQSQHHSANLNVIKSFIARDGEVWQNSSIADADQFDLQNLIRTRDPRFEATFHYALHPRAAALLWTAKFVARTANDTNPIYLSNTNNNDAPVIRFGEVLLNWIEARAVLAEHLGGAPITQADIDRSINALRDRPLHPDAVAKGVTQTLPMQLASLPNDPLRDADVSQLMWEIRRERRMELFQELPRLLDLRRWRRLHYMDGVQNPTILRGIWINNFATEIPGFLTEGTQVERADGTIVTYNGTNAAEMVGFFIPNNAENRAAFGTREYLAPIPLCQITLYERNGFPLTQTPGW